MHFYCKTETKIDTLLGWFLETFHQPMDYITEHFVSNSFPHFSRQKSAKLLLLPWNVSFNFHRTKGQSKLAHIRTCLDLSGSSSIDRTSHSDLQVQVQPGGHQGQRSDSSWRPTAESYFRSKVGQPDDQQFDDCGNAHSGHHSNLRQQSGGIGDWSVSQLHLGLHSQSLRLFILFPCHGCHLFQPKSTTEIVTEMYH